MPWSFSMALKWKWCSKCDVYFEDDKCFCCGRKRYMREESPSTARNPYTFTTKSVSVEQVLDEVLSQPQV